MESVNGTDHTCRALSGWAQLGVLFAGLVVSAQTIAQVDNNPDVVRECGADIVLLLDASDSIRTWQPEGGTELDRNGAVDLVTDAAFSFLEAFSNTNSRVSVVSYNIDATRQLGFRPVTDQTLRSDGPFRRAIGDPGTSAGGIPSGAANSYVADVTDQELDSSFFTNWEAGLLEAREVIRPDDATLATRDGLPVLVFHVTDGDPNRRLDANGDVTLFPRETARHVSDAAGVADLLKEVDGAHIYTVGIGLTNDSIQNLVDISGPDIYFEEFTDNNFDPLRDDVLIASDFDKLKAVLDGVVLSLCSPSLVIRKWEQDFADSDTYTVASGWSFDAEPSTDDQFWNWTSPTDGSSVVSDENGIARFEWHVTERAAWNGGNVVIREQDDSDAFEFDDATCLVTAGENADAELEISAVSEGFGFSVPVNTNEIVTCDVYNTVNTISPPDDPRIVLDKHTDSEVFSRIGDVIDYTYKVTNVGPGVLRDIITVEDDKIKTVTCPVDFPDGELQPGGFVMCSGSYVIGQDDIDETEVVNIATAFAGVLVSNDDTETVVYEPELPSIVLDKETEKETYNEIGEVIDYTYTVTNAGPGILTDVITVRDNKISDVSCPQTLPDGVLAVGDFVVCTGSYVVIEDDISNAEIVNVARAYAGELESNDDDERVVYSPPPNEERDDDKDESKKKDKTSDKGASTSTQSLKAAAAATETSEPTEAASDRRLATRTASWYATRPGAVRACLDTANGQLDLGVLRIMDEQHDDQIDAFERGSVRGDSDSRAETALSLGVGLLNAHVRRLSDGSRRSRVDQQCVAVARTAMAAQCNVQWLKTDMSFDIDDAIDRISTHCRGNRRSARANAAGIEDLRLKLRKFNRSGRFETLPASARSVELRSGAVRGDDPTDPGD